MREREREGESKRWNWRAREEWRMREKDKDKTGDREQERTGDQETARERGRVVGDLERARNNVAQHDRRLLYKAFCPDIGDVIGHNLPKKHADNQTKKTTTNGWRLKDRAKRARETKIREPTTYPNAFWRRTTQPCSVAGLWEVKRRWLDRLV